MEDDEFSYRDIEQGVKDFKQYLITDARNWQTVVADERHYGGFYDIYFALILRDLRFDHSPEDFSGFLEVTDQGIIDEMHKLDDTYGIDNRTRYEDFSRVAMGRIIPGDFLCIECVREILERYLTPGDFGAEVITMRSGGIITQLFHNEEALTTEEASELSELKEQCSQEYADRIVQEGRSRHTIEELDNDWNPCNKCERPVWGDLGISTDSTAGYSLEKKIWNHVWERWVQIRNKEE